MKNLALASMAIMTANGYYFLETDLDASMLE
jgi:hypothetical protein